MCHLLFKLLYCTSMINIIMLKHWMVATQIICVIFTQKLGEDEPMLTSIFFRWVGSTWFNHQRWKNILSLAPLRSNGISCNHSAEHRRGNNSRRWIRQKCHGSGDPMDVVNETCDAFVLFLLEICINLR